MAWWTPAVAILTFFSPFTLTSNGYFCTWAATVCAYLMLGKAFARVQVAMQSMSAIQEDANVKSLAGTELTPMVVLCRGINAPPAIYHDIMPHVLGSSYLTCRST